MKAKILKTFQDKEKKELQRKDGTWSGTKERYAEINETVTYLEAIEDEKPTQKQGAKDSETKERKLKEETK